MDDLEKDGRLKADLKGLSAKLITPEAANRLAKLSPASREKVIDVSARMIARLLGRPAPVRKPISQASITKAQVFVEPSRPDDAER